MRGSTETLPSDPAILMRSIIQRIATGPELSKDISQEEARAGMRFILEGKIDPVQAGIFLIALRMKRETDDEVRGVLEAIREVTRTVTAPVVEVIDLADPYDGFNRMLPASPFLPAVLAACGVPAAAHGVERLGPKYGVTHRQVLRAAGQPVDLAMGEAAARLGDPALGWAYVDQKAYCPKLYDLIGLRTQIVKRPVITTVEVCIGPIRGRRKTHLVTGYVHKAYPRIYALLARQAGFDSALIVRGVEGGVIPSLQKAGRFFYYRDQGEDYSVDIDPAELSIDQSVRAVPLPADLQKAGGAGETFDATTLAQAAAQAGMEALAGQPGPTREGLVFSAALCLWQVGRYDSVPAAARAVREVLDSGRALVRMQRAAP
ncbi:MAG: anthranilate phosphoribosyltransferase [Pseudomonadota bacterium]|nr:anthranilate phosphoribosyltransferase [Pseudomonadota bacterium]